jgi:uncharacterized membrane protein
MPCSESGRKQSPPQEALCVGPPDLPLLIAGSAWNKRPRSPLPTGDTHFAAADDGQNLRRGRVMVNPFDLKTALLAKHAQHVVLIHFPIALFIAAVGFDLIAQWTKRRGLADAAYYNLFVAAISTVPVLATGILAWQFQLEGQKLKGILLLHLVLACASSVVIWLVWWVHFRARRRAEALPGYRLAVELLGIGLVALTGHLGGFLSGVNGPG